MKDAAYYARQGCRTQTADYAHIENAIAEAMTQARADGFAEGVDRAAFKAQVAVDESYRAEAIPRLIRALVPRPAEASLREPCTVKGPANSDANSTEATASEPECVASRRVRPEVHLEDQIESREALLGGDYEPDRDMDNLHRSSATEAPGYVERERDEAQARFAVLWSFLQWVRTRNWAISQLDDRATQLHGDGPVEIGTNAVAQRDELAALLKEGFAYVRDANRLMAEDGSLDEDDEDGANDWMERAATALAKAGGGA